MATPIDSYLAAGRVVKPYRKTTTKRSLSTPLEAGGLGQGRLKWQNPLYRFQLTVEFDTLTAADSFRGFFEDNVAARDITWDNTLDEETASYTCRFGTDSIAMEWNAANLKTFTFELIGVKT